jgi:hypothetical protein
VNWCLSFLRQNGIVSEVYWELSAYREPNYRAQPSRDQSRIWVSWKETLRTTRSAPPWRAACRGLIAAKAPCEAAGLSCYKNRVLWAAAGGGHDCPYYGTERATDTENRAVIFVLVRRVSDTYPHARRNSARPQPSMRSCCWACWRLNTGSCRTVWQRASELNHSWRGARYITSPRHMTSHRRRY